MDEDRKPDAEESAEQTPIELHAVFHPDGTWKISCPLLGMKEIPTVVKKGFIEDLRDAYRTILFTAEREKNQTKPKNKVIAPFWRGVRR